MIKYKFLNGFIYCNGFRMLMTSVVEALNEMDGELSKGKEDYKNLFEAFEEGQKVLGDANKRLENLSRVNKEYKEVLTPIWDYCRENVKVELGKSISEALIESHKLLQSQVWSLEQRCKLLEEDSKDTAKYVEIQRGELAKANERVKELENSFKQSIPIVDTLYALARNQLWIAYVWNDHNFPLNPEKYAKEAAESMGITNVDDANKLVEAFKQLLKERDSE